MQIVKFQHKNYYLATMLQKRLMRTEKIGIAISLICAIHCLLMPVALLYLGRHSLHEHAHGMFDIIILILASIFMAITFAQSLRKPHFNKIFILTLLGCSTFIFSFFVSSPFNHYCFVAGSVFWLVAHLINYKKHAAPVKNV